MSHPWLPADCKTHHHHHISPTPLHCPAYETVGERHIYIPNGGCLRQIRIACKLFGHNICHNTDLFTSSPTSFPANGGLQMLQIVGLPLCIAEPLLCTPKYLSSNHVSRQSQQHPCNEPAERSETFYRHKQDLRSREGNTLKFTLYATWRSHSLDSGTSSKDVIGGSGLLQWLCKATDYPQEALLCRTILDSRWASGGVGDRQ